MYAGIFNKGDHIPVFLSVRDANNAPTVPDAVPTVAIFDSSFGSPTVHNLNVLDRYGPTTGLFVYTFRHNAAGSFTGVIRYAVSSNQRRISFKFDVRDVGSNIGVVRSISELAKPFEEGIGYQTEDGQVYFGRGPY